MISTIMVLHGLCFVPSSLHVVATMTIAAVSFALVCAFL